MAITTYGNSAAASTSIRDRLVARIEVVRSDYAKWRTYRRTINELGELSHRDLADLGINRSMIRNIALEAAYGE